MDVTVYQRNDKLLQVTIMDGAEPLDLTGCTVRYAASAAGLNKIGTVTDAPSGQVEIDLTSADTDIPIGAYVHELLVIDVEGNRYTAMTGRFTVLRSIIKE